HRAAPAFLPARRPGPGARSASRALHAGRDAARTAAHGTRPMIAIAPVLRAAAHSRLSRHPVAAGACGALLAGLAVALLSPLSLAGGAGVQQAAVTFLDDLAQYRAAPEDV